MSTTTTQTQTQATPLTDNEQQLLQNYLDPNLTLQDLTAIHRLTLSQLEELLEREESRAHLARAARLSTARAEHLKATSQDKAAAALADLLTNEYTHQPPSPETRRRTATAVLGIKPPPKRQPAQPQQQ